MMKGSTISSEKSCSIDSNPHTEVMDGVVGASDSSSQMNNVRQVDHRDGGGRCNDECWNGDSHPAGIVRPQCQSPLMMQSSPNDSWDQSLDYI